MKERNSKKKDMKWQSMLLLLLTLSSVVCAIIGQPILFCTKAPVSANNGIQTTYVMLSLCSTKNSFECKKKKRKEKKVQPQSDIFTLSCCPQPLLFGRLWRQRTEKLLGILWWDKKPQRTQEAGDFRTTKGSKRSTREMILLNKEQGLIYVRAHTHNQQQ